MNIEHPGSPVMMCLVNFDSRLSNEFSVLLREKVFCTNILNFVLADAVREGIA